MPVPLEEPDEEPDEPPPDEPEEELEDELEDDVEVVPAPELLDELVLLLVAELVPPPPPQAAKASTPARIKTLFMKSPGDCVVVIAETIDSGSQPPIVFRLDERRRSAEKRPPTGGLFATR